MENRLLRLRPYLTDGRLAADNNAAERARRGCALNRKNGLFHGLGIRRQGARHRRHPDQDSQTERRRPHAWLADSLARISDCKITHVDEPMP